MTPKQKAQELIDKYLKASFNCKDCDMPYCDMKCTSLNIREAKQCALIAVDEILSVVWYVPVDTEYWQEVKQEIENL